MGLSYRQLRSLRSLASGYDCIALRAGNAADGGYVAPPGRYGRGEAVLPPAALADARLQAVTIVSRFAQVTPLCGYCSTLRALWEGRGCLTASCAHCVRLQAVTTAS